MKILLGGGTLAKPGFTNIDILALPGVDIVHDISKSLPLEDNTVEHVIADNVFELLPDIGLIMDEIWRVCKHDAKVSIKVPYYMSESGYKDVRNLHYFTERSFEHFDRSYIEDGRLPEYGYNSNFKTEKIEFNYYRRGVKYIPFIWFWRRCFWNIVRTVSFQLRVVKK